MDRLACVNVKNLALQRVLSKNPSWVKYPTAVVSEDKAQGRVLQINSVARQSFITPGQSYAQALALNTDLRASALDASALTKSAAELCESLKKFSPGVESCKHNPGVFWLDAGGLERLWSSPKNWGTQILKALRHQGFRAQIVIGFSRFSTFILSQALSQEFHAYHYPRDENQDADRVALEHSGLESRVVTSLHRLGIMTIGEFRAIPAEDIRLRFSTKAFEIHTLASGRTWDPLQSEPGAETIEEVIFFDDAESNVERLTFAAKKSLDELLLRVAEHKCAVGSVYLSFKIERSPPQIEMIRPARPTLDARLLMRLIHLRLSSIIFASGVSELRMNVEEVTATPQQLSLFEKDQARSVDAGHQAFARLRASFGNGVIVKAVLRDAHLSEGRYAWQPCERIEKPVQTEAAAKPRLIRRVYLKPKRLVNGDENRGTLARALNKKIIQLDGPHLVSGGWWGGGTTARAYYFSRAESGDCDWVYYDRERHSWFLYGALE